MSSPFSVTFELSGWRLFFAHLAVEPGVGSGLEALCAEVAVEVRGRYKDTSAIAASPAIQALRKLFRQAGCDPTRYRPSSEALLRRLVKGDDLPTIHPLVDLNNCLSATLAVPCCVMVEGSFSGPLTWRAGREGESYVSLRGPFKLDGKPLLVDGDGPLDTPITGNERVKVTSSTERAWLVAYLPDGVVTEDDARSCLERMAPRAGVVATRLGAAAG